MKIIEEVIMTELLANSMNKKDSHILNRSWKP
jgi:hypothetical protein